MSILRWTCRFLKRSGWGVLPCVWFALPNGTPVTGPCTNSRDCLGQLPVLASPGDSTVLCKGLFLRHRVVGGRGAGERDGREKGEPDSSCHLEPTPVMLALTYSWEQSPCDLIVPQGLPLNALALGISCQHLNFLGGWKEQRLRPSHHMNSIKFYHLGPWMLPIHFDPFITTYVLKFSEFKDVRFGCYISDALKF